MPLRVQSVGGVYTKTFEKVCNFTARAAGCTVDTRSSGKLVMVGWIRSNAHGIPPVVVQNQFLEHCARNPMSGILVTRYQT